MVATVTLRPADHRGLGRSCRVSLCDSTCEWRDRAIKLAQAFRRLQLSLLQLPLLHKDIVYGRIESRFIENRSYRDITTKALVAFLRSIASDNRLPIISVVRQSLTGRVRLQVNGNLAQEHIPNSIHQHGATITMAKRHRV